MRLLLTVVMTAAVVMVMSGGASSSPSRGGGGGGVMTRDFTMKLRLIDNGYDDVVVKIDDDIPSIWCNGIFDGIQKVMSRASSQLYLATDRRAFFRSVTVVVPSTWISSQCPGTLNITAPPPVSPAFVVAQPHPVYAHAPWTLQVGGCGQPGQNVYLTPRYLAEVNYTEALGDPGRVIVHEWAKYRWGVFEEFGHPGDPLYPAFHRTPANPHTPTGCSNVPVEGSMASCDNPRDSACRFTANYNNNDGVTSSLMYMHHLPYVTHFCDSATHDTTSPNRQNGLCQHRSTWDVIMKHEDFANHNNPPGDATRDVTPKFNFVKPAPSRYVIVVEDTTVMNVQKRWDFLRKAVRKLLVYDVPAGSMVGIVLFDQTARTKLPLTPTPESLDERQRLATNSLPRYPTAVAQSQKCLICGLQEAVRMLEKEDENKSASGGVIFLITSGTPLPLVPFDIEQFANVAIKRGARIVPIIYPVTDRNPQPSAGVETLARMSGTQSFAVLDEGIGSDSKVSMMVALMDAMYAAIKIFIPDPKTLPLVVHKKEFPGGIGSISQGTFTVDRSLGGEIKFSLIYYDLGHVGNMVNLIDPRGRVLDPINLQEEDGDVNMIFITVRDAMPGEWRYRVENRADSHQSLFTRVIATPRTPNSTSSSAMMEGERETHAITLTAWTSSTDNVVNMSDVNKPVIVYAKLWCGTAPVVDAHVEASLQRLGVNGTGNRYGPITFRLLDSGNGDPDLTRGDGIYSRYLPAITAESGRYTLSVTATDNKGTAQVITSSQPPPNPRPRMYPRNHVPYSGVIGTQYTRAHAYNSEWLRCCGSFVPFSTARETGRLARSVTVGLVDFEGGGLNLSHIPPSRIADFRAEVNPASQQITFTWTAPGEWRDYGTVMHYQVAFSRDAAATGQGAGERAREWTTPEPAGKLSTHIVRWGRHDGVYYASIRGVNRMNVSGPWSNTAEFYMPHPPTTTEINTRGSTQGGPLGGSVSELGVTTPQPGTLSTRDILAIVGAGCGLLVVVLILAVYYLIVVTRRRRHHQEKKAVEVLEPVTTTPANCDTDSETDSITKPPPPPEALAVGEPEAKGKRPLSPIQSWPASTLLAEHERRHPNDPSEGGGEGVDISLHHPDLGVPYMPTMQPAQPHPFYYHTPNGHYIEDNLAMDSGSVVSTQPSDSLLVYKVDTSTTDSIRPPSSSVTPTPVTWEAGRRQGPMKVPPPTPPKPTLSAQLTMGGVASTPLGTERKRRNVTQV